MLRSLFQTPPQRLTSDPFPAQDRPPAQSRISNLVITTDLEPARLIIDGGITDTNRPGTLAVMRLLWVHKDAWKTRVLSELHSPATFRWNRATLNLSLAELGDVGFGLAWLVAEFRDHDGSVAQQVLDGHVIAFDFDSVFYTLVSETYDDVIYNEFVGLVMRLQHETSPVPKTTYHHLLAFPPIVPITSTNQIQERDLCRTFDSLRARLNPWQRPAGTDAVAFALWLVDSCAPPTPTRRPRF